LSSANYWGYIGTFHLTQILNRSQSASATA
jgi:hypothetical protein